MIAPAECEPMDLEAALNWRHPSFIVEEKFDGIRAVTTIHQGKAIVTGRRWSAPGILAELTKADAITVHSFHQEMEGCIIDGELMADGTYHVFDIMRLGTHETTAMPLKQRQTIMGTLSEFLPENFKLVRHALSVAALGAFAEGIVWKDLRSKYGFGFYKAKRVETLDLKVVRLMDNGVAEVQHRGKVVGVPESVKVGDCIEVEAFKVFPSGKLRNGKFVRTRDDK